MAERGRVTGLVIDVPAGSRRTAAQALIIAALGAAVVAFLAVIARRHGFFDLRVYYGAINYWMHDGGQVYDYLLPYTEYGFTYPPFAAVVMAPMAYVGWHTAIAVSLALSVGALATIMYWLVGPIAKRRGWPRWFALVIALELAVALEPVWETVNFGQVNLVLMAMVAGDLLLLVRRNHRFAGIGIGLAAAIKLTPGAFIVYLLVTRRWRAAGVATATAAAATWLAATLAPDASRVFWTDAVWNTDRVGSRAFVSNQSLNGIAARIDPLDPSVTLWAAMVIVAIAVWVLRVRRAVANRDETAALALTGLLMCLISPISWIHHLVWVLPAMVLLFDHGLDPARSVWSRRWLLLAGIGSYALLCSKVVWVFEFRTTGWDGSLGSNLYVLLMCALMLGLPLRQLADTGSATGRRGRPTVADLPDLVELDRQVNAAFNAKDAGLPVPEGFEEAPRPLVGAERR